MEEVVKPLAAARKRLKRIEKKELAAAAKAAGVKKPRKKPKPKVAKAPVEDSTKMWAHLRMSHKISVANGGVITFGPGRVYGDAATLRDLLHREGLVIKSEGELFEDRAHIISASGKATRVDPSTFDFTLGQVAPSSIISGNRP